MLEVRFEALPNELVEKINRIEDLELFKTLLRQAITIEGLDDFQGLLEA
ncbi:hypothetical protein [Crocosphaera watsonii]|uniref:Transposase n=1 Tax=Crocosphaera watsonii WH 8502 TaxID=423474 RepID=T2IAG6_CROWT|nr:hypothetical protein [Crocosphaera watsonii]CCQ49215.1 FIG00571371: hypothetical protein [Crocosphaera watsonii WH 8502]